VSSRYSPVEKLETKHDVGEFDCGSDAQTIWVKRRALESQAGGMSRVFVVRRLSDDKVVGYYVLTTGSVLHADASRRLTVGTGGYDIPLVILTGPGVDLSEQGRGLGRALVVDVFRRIDCIDRIAEEVGVRAPSSTPRTPTPGASTSASRPSSPVPSTSSSSSFC